MLVTRCNYLKALRGIHANAIPIATRFFAADDNAYGRQPSEGHPDKNAFAADTSPGMDCEMQTGP